MKASPLPSFLSISFSIIIAALGISLTACDVPQPNIAPEYQNPQNTATNATAVSVVNIANSAQAAGWDFVDEGHGDIRRIVELIVEGHKIDNPSSPFNGSMFRVPGLSIATQEAVAQRLKIEHGKLTLAPLY